MRKILLMLILPICFGLGYFLGNRHWIPEEIVLIPPTSHEESTLYQHQPDESIVDLVSDVVPRSIFTDYTLLTDEQINRIVKVNMEIALEYYGDSPHIRVVSDLFPKIFTEESITPEESLKFMKSLYAINLSYNNKIGVEIMQEYVEKQQKSGQIDE